MNYVGVLGLLDLGKRRFGIASDTYGDEALSQGFGEVQNLPGLVPSRLPVDGYTVVLFQSYLHSVTVPARSWGCLR